MADYITGILAKSMRQRQEHGWSYPGCDIEAEADRIAKIVRTTPDIWGVAAFEISKLELRNG